MSDVDGHLESPLGKLINIISRTSGAPMKDTFIMGDVANLLVASS